MISRFDTSVFAEPVSGQELAGRAPTGIARIRQGSTPVLWGLAAACLAVWLVASMAVGEAFVDSFGVDVSPVNVGSGIFLGGVLLAAIGFAVQGMGEDPRLAAARMDRFVERNGLTYTQDPKLPKADATIFDQGHHRQAWRRFRNGPSHSLAFEVANYSYQTGPRVRERNEPPAVTSWTYATVTGERSLPRMLLDTKDNDRWFGSSLPVSLAKSQIVPLGGDLDKHFTLYAPEGHEAAARAVFTEEVLRRLLVEAPGFDVETIDNQIVFFTRGELDLSSEAAWARLSPVIFGVGALMAAKTPDAGNMRFIGSAPEEVKPGGRVLKNRFFTPALFWTLGGFAVLVLARVLLQGPLDGLL